MSNEPATLERLWDAPTVKAAWIGHETRHIETPCGTYKCLYWLAEGMPARHWSYAFRDGTALATGATRADIAIRVLDYAVRHWPQWGGFVEIGIPGSEG